MKKKMVIVGGANGVGKTTFAYQYQQEYKIDYLGADDISKEFSKTHSGNSELRAGREFFRRLEWYLIENRSVMVESTLSGLGLTQQIKKFKANGYRVHMIYVFLADVELCKKRIRLRVKKGGHNVPPDEIVRRFQRSIENFQSIYLPLADTWQLLYNGLKRPIEVAVGENEKTMIIDEELFKIYKEVAN